MANYKEDYTIRKTQDVREKERKLLESVKAEERKKLKNGWKWVEIEPGTLVLKKVKKSEK